LSYILFLAKIFIHIIGINNNIFRRKTKMKNYEVYNFNESQINFVAQSNNDDLCQRMSEVNERNVTLVSEGLETPPVKMCYPY
jgi:hypothetical protein